MSQDTNVIVVCGPPGSGKTTYVDKRKLPGDLMVDRDRIMVALSGQPMHHRPAQLQTIANAAFDAAVARVAYETVNLNRAWIVGGFPKVEQRNTFRKMFPKCRIIVLEVPAGECVSRMYRSGTRPGNKDAWGDIAAKWWRLYEKDPIDEVIR